MPITWIQAETSCVQHGANLTSVMDQTEMIFLHALLLDNQGQTLPDAYIGRLANILLIIQ